ncbi:MAG: hypothetical protein DWH87_06800 [Planctomycetota bacterium]|nr:MAG: hypothetical protein DWH87_06800 [Planctomycetota bacterium]
MARQLSPAAQARLAAARAVAQGKALPTPTAAPGQKAQPSPRQGSVAGAKPAAEASPAPGSNLESKGRSGIVILALLGVVGMGTIAGGAWMTLGRRPDLVRSTATIQKGLLNGEMRGAAEKKAVADVIRNADQMTKSELEAARKALDEEWKRCRDEAIDAFVAAPESDRPRLADEGIDRTIAYRKLRFGLSPQAREANGRRQKPPKDADRRKLFDLYAEALERQSKKRGVDLPEWQ